MPCIPHLTGVYGPLRPVLPLLVQRPCMRPAHVSVCGRFALSVSASVLLHKLCNACPRNLRRVRHRCGQAVRRCMYARKHLQQTGRSGAATDSLPRPSPLPFHIRLIAQSLDKLPFTSPPLSFAALVPPQYAALPFQNIQGLIPYR